MILKIGNCMNAGNKLKGQADGFEISAIEKTLAIKDANGKSIMSTICEKLHQADPENFHKIAEDFTMCKTALKCVVMDIKKDSELLQKQQA